MDMIKRVVKLIYLLAVLGLATFFLVGISLSAIARGISSLDEFVLLGSTLAVILLSWHVALAITIQEVKELASKRINYRREC